MTKQEVTELLVATSQIDDGSADHGFLRDQEGTTLGLYVDTGEPGPLQRQTDWWLGPIILLLVVILIVGAYTIARSIIDLLF